MKAILGKKIGMTQIFTEEGLVIPVTVVHAENTVIQKKTVEKDGYSSIQVGYEAIKETKVNNAKKGQFKSIGSFFKYLREIRVNEDLDISTGDKFGVDIFSIGDKVIVSGKSKGKGFAGTIKRHNFAGGPATHGSKSHRIPGSSGAPTRNGRILKGKKMAGQMGNVNETISGIKVVGVDVEKGLLLLKGGIPGSSNGLVYVYDKKDKYDLGKITKSTTEAPEEVKADVSVAPEKEVVEKSKPTPEVAEVKETSEKAKTTEPKEVKAEKKVPVEVEKKEVEKEAKAEVVKETKAKTEKKETASEDKKSTDAGKEENK